MLLKLKFLVIVAAELRNICRKELCEYIERCRAPFMSLASNQLQIFYYIPFPTTFSSYPNTYTEIYRFYRSVSLRDGYFLTDSCSNIVRVISRNLNFNHSTQTSNLTGILTFYLEYDFFGVVRV